MKKIILFSFFILFALLVKSQSDVSKNLINLSKKDNCYSIYIEQYLENQCFRENDIKNYRNSIKKEILKDNKVTYCEIPIIGYYKFIELKDSVKQYEKNGGIEVKIVLAQLEDTLAEKDVIAKFLNDQSKSNDIEYLKKVHIRWLTSMNTKKSREILFTYLKLFPLTYKFNIIQDYGEEIWSLSYYAAREVFKLYCEIPIEKKLTSRYSMLEEKDVIIIKDWLDKNNEEYRNIKDPVKEEENRLINNPKDEREKKIGEQIRKYRERKEKEVQEKLEKEKSDKK